MELLSLILLAIGLSMDAFAVSVCKGLAMKKITIKKGLIVGAWFGTFQALMPFLGYILGIQFESYINTIAPWIAFCLLELIGIHMIKEAMPNACKREDEFLKVKEMFLLSLATSIDALVVGLTFALVPLQIIKEASTLINTIIACSSIGVTTFILSFIGVKTGNVFGVRYKNKAGIAGGIILMLLGLKVLLNYFDIL